jgi:WD40 repeat protein
MTPVVFSPNGKHLAIGTSLGVFVFDAENGRRVLRVPLPEKGYVQFIRFPSDRSRVAVAFTNAGKARGLTYYSLADGKETQTAQFPTPSPTHVLDMAPDGSSALAINWMQRAYLWDIRNGREAWGFPYPGATFVLPSGDGKQLAVVGDKRELFDARTGKFMAAFPDPGTQFRNWFEAALSPDGRIAVAATRGDAVAILSTRGENGLRILPADRRPRAFAFSPDSRYLVGPMATGTRVWDLSAPDDKGPVARLPGALATGFSPDGRVLAAADEGSIVLYSVGDWKLLPRSADPPSSIWQVRFVDGGRRVLGYTRQGWVAWPAAGGESTRLSADPGGPVPPNRPDNGADAQANTSVDGHVGVDVLYEPVPGNQPGKYQLRVTDLATGKDRRIPADGPVRDCPQVSLDGKYVSAFVRREFLTWDATTGEVMQRLTTKGSQQFAILPGRDGTIARSVDGEFNGTKGRSDPPDWNAVTVTDHRAGRSWKMHPVPWTIFPDGVRFSPDGSRVILLARFDADYKRTSVSIWDTATGRRLMKWDGDYFSRLAAVDLSADHRSLLIGNKSGRLLLIEAATGGERAAFVHQGEVFSAAFHPDGTKAVSSSPDAPVFVWDLLGKSGRWDSAKADAIWTDLASTEAKVAYGSIRLLRTNPTEAIRFLKERVKLPTPPSEELVAKWLKNLDSASFADRERSQRELTAIAELVRANLETARKTASLETSRRLDVILKSTEDWTPDRLRQARACEILEAIATPDAFALVKAWSTGPVGARLTNEAKESVGRSR